MKSKTFLSILFSLIFMGDLFMIFHYGCTSPNEKNVVPIEETKKKPKEVISFTLRAIGTSMQNMEFDLKKIKVQANTRIKITLINEFSDTTMYHNFLVVNFGKVEEVALAGSRAGKENKFVPDSPDVIFASDLAAPLETITFEFDAPSVGIYEFVCTYPGHYQRMQGSFVVSN